MNILVQKKKKNRTDETKKLSIKITGLTGHNSLGVILEKNS